METNYMAALASLDETPNIEQSGFEPIGDQSTEVDAESETAAFAARPEPDRDIETKPLRIDATSAAAGRSAFAEAAGLY